MSLIHNLVASASAQGDDGTTAEDPRVFLLPRRISFIPPFRLTIPPQVHRVRPTAQIKAPIRGANDPQWPIFQTLITARCGALETLRNSD